MHRSLFAHGWIVAGLLSLWLSPLVWAQDPLVGKRVVVIKDEAPLAASGKEVAKARECTVFTVDKVDGEWLWIKSERAYLRRADVVPFEDAIGHYTQQLETNKTAKNYSNRAYVWRLKGELDLAIGDLNDAIRLKPTLSRLFLSRGMLWGNKKEYDKAIADYGEAIRLDPKNDMAYNNRGSVWTHKKEYDKAIADLDEAVKLTDPSEKKPVFHEPEIAGGDSVTTANALAIVLSNRGWAWQHKGDYDKAIADYKEAIRLDPKFRKPRANLREAWGELNAWDKVVADCDAELEKEPGSVSALKYRGWAFSWQGAHDKAIRDFAAILRIDPKNPYALRERRKCWSMKGDWEKLIADHDITIQSDPNNAAAWNEKAWIRATCSDEKYRNGQQAVEYATKACELTAWKVANNLTTLAAAYAEAGDFDKAVEWQKKGMDVAPADQKADFETRVKLYQEKKPYRQPVTK